MTLIPVSSDYKLTVYEESFDLQSIFIISPSIHTLNDISFDLEIQMMFKSDTLYSVDIAPENKISLNLLVNKNIETEKKENSMFFIPIIQSLKDNKNVQTKIFDENITHSTQTNNINKLDESIATFHNYFTYLGKTVFAPCGSHEIPQIVIDINQAQTNENSDQTDSAFINSKDIKSIMKYLQNEHRNNTAIKQWEDLTNRALLPFDGALVAFV